MHCSKGTYIRPWWTISEAGLWRSVTQLRPCQVARLPYERMPEPGEYHLSKPRPKPFRQGAAGSLLLPMDTAMASCPR